MANGALRVMPDALFVNNGVIRKEDVLPMTESRPTEPLEVLRKRFQNDGYLFLKRILPRPDVLGCRSDYFTFFSTSGMLKPGSNPIDGTFWVRDEEKDIFVSDGTTEQTDPEWTKNISTLVQKAHREPWYLKFISHPTLLDFIGKFTSWEENTHLLERSLLRHSTPGTEATGVHYDQIFLRSGQPTSITVWIPIGDISWQGGGLIYLENGDILGQEIERDFTEKATKSGLTNEEAISAYNRNMLSNGSLTPDPIRFSKDHGRQWLVSDYEAGDVVLHTPYMVHAATVNHDSENKIRLSTDLRFVDKSQPYDKRWDNAFSFGDGL